MSTNFAHHYGSYEKEIEVTDWIEYLNQGLFVQKR